MSFINNIKSFVGQLSGDPKRSAVTKDRRQVDRTVCAMQGFVTFPKRPAFPPIACAIKDFSANGARIEILEKITNPALFEDGMRLFIEPKNYERECKIAWNKDGTFGVKFEGLKHEPSRQYPSRNR